MIEKIKKYWLRYAVTLAAGACLCFLYLNNHEFSAAETLEVKCRLLGDAFFIPGSLMLLFAALLFCTGQGAFNGITYSMGTFARAVLPFMKLRDESYHEYVERKKEKRVRGYSFLVVCGVLFLAVAVVFYIIA